MLQGFGGEGGVTDRPLDMGLAALGQELRRRNLLILFEDAVMTLRRINLKQKQRVIIQIRDSHGKRKYHDVNLKKIYPKGTTFFLRWLPKGAKNCKYQSLPNATVGAAMTARAAKELELTKEPAMVAPKSHRLTIDELMKLSKSIRTRLAS
jgi:hypothetical protein